MRITQIMPAHNWHADYETPSGEFFSIPLAAWVVVESGSEHEVAGLVPAKARGSQAKLVLAHEVDKKFTGYSHGGEVATSLTGGNYYD